MYLHCFRGVRLETKNTCFSFHHFWDQNTMHSLVFLHSLLLFFLRVWWMEACLLFQHQTCAHLKKIPACTPPSQEPHCRASKHRQGCDIAWPLCDYLMAGIKDEVAGMQRHSQLNQCVQFSFYVNRAAYKSARLNKLIIFLCNTVNILNLEYYKNCPSGIIKKKKSLIIHYCKI